MLGTVRKWLTVMLREGEVGVVSERANISDINFSLRALTRDLLLNPKH